MDTAFWISGSEVDGQDELQIFRQRFSSEQRFCNCEEAKPAEISVGPSSFVKISVCMISGWTAVIAVLPPSSAVMMAVVVEEQDDMIYKKNCEVFWSLNGGYIQGFYVKVI